MNILRVEELVFGAEDVAAGTKYFDDWGLETIARSDKGGDFTMPSGQVIKVRAASDGSLPMTNEAGSTLREAIWGVDNKALARRDRDRAQPRPRMCAAMPTARCTRVDPHGFAIGFRVAAPKTRCRSRCRRTVSIAPFDGKQRVKPLRIGHLVYQITRAQRGRGPKFLCRPARLPHLGSQRRFR